MNKRAVIFGIKGLALTKKEKFFFKSVKPWGIILFSRNIKNFIQLKKLTEEIRSIFNDKKFPLLVDIEGGKVSRFNNIIDLTTFSQNYFAQLYKKDKKLFFIYYNIYINTLTSIFKNVGININTAPVLDVRRKNSHNIIGTRSFSIDHKIVSKLGNYCINFFNKKKNRHSY